MDNLKIPAMFRWIYLRLSNRYLGYHLGIGRHIAPVWVWTNKQWTFRIVNVHGEPVSSRKHVAKEDFSDFVFTRPLHKERPYK